MKLRPGKLLKIQSSMIAYPWNDGDPERLVTLTKIWLGSDILLAEAAGAFESRGASRSSPLIVIQVNEIIMPFKVQVYSNEKHTIAMLAFLWKEKTWVMFPEKHLMPDDTEDPWQGFTLVP